MKTHHMRLIDRLVGIPLCFLLSVWHDLQISYQRAVRKNIKKSPVKNLLFIELSELGSAVVAFSALSRARARYPHAKLYFLIFEKHRESVELLGIIPKENILTIHDNDLRSFLASTLQVLSVLRDIPVDTCIDLELFSRCTAILSYLSGATRRIGFHNFKGEGLYRGSFLTHRVLYNPHQHMSLNFLSLVCSIGQPSTELLLKQDVSEFLTPLPRYDSSMKEVAKVRQKLNAKSRYAESSTNYIILNPDPGEAIPIRGWPSRSYAQLARDLLHDYPNALIVVIGLEESKVFADRILAHLPPGRGVDFTGETNSLTELIALFTLSSLLITNDSGPAHLASLTSIHSIVLFGPETPKLYAPLSDRVTQMYANLSCSPCLSAYNHRATICTDNVCLKSIQVSDVRLAVRRALEPSPLRIAL